MSLIEYVDNFEEVDTAMFNMFTGCIIDGKEVPVTYYSPDVDLRTLERPSIVLYRTPPFIDYSRWQQDEIRDNFKYDLANKLVGVSLRKPPEPWSVPYTVRTTYEYQADGVVLNRFLFRQFPRGSYLAIKGISYDLFQTGGRLSGSGYKDFGRIDEGKKKNLSETYNFRVDILLDIHDRVDTGVASGVTVSTNQK